MTKQENVLGKVLWVQKYTGKLLRFAITRPLNYRFSAGQYSRIGFSEGLGFIWRAYSIMSGKNEDFLEYYVVLIKNGLMSQRLATLKEGDEILIDLSAKGGLLPERFVLGED